MVTSPRRRLAALSLVVVALASACSPQRTRVSPGPVPSDSPSDGAPPTPEVAPSTPTATSPGPAPAPAQIRWKGCGPGAFQCATVAVPLDWSQPGSGQTVKLGVIRLPASGAATQRIGSLFVNPGGPGASAQDIVREIQDVLPVEVLRRFDIVGFDPRGVGTSQPLYCEQGAQMDAFLASSPVPKSPGDIQQFIRDDATFAAGCVKAAGLAFLAHMDTLSTARDMDYLRASVGDAKLTYIGYSYGTFLGAEYANLFPTHVRALVLDGAVDPSLGPLEFDLQQGVAFDKELGKFFDSCNQGCAFASNGNPRAGFNALEARVAAQPIKVGNRQLTQALFLNGVASAMYVPSLWPGLATALSQADRGDGARLLAMSDEQVGRKPDGTYDSSTSVSVAVNCIDTTYPKDVAAYQAAADQATQQAPVIGPGDVWSSLACADWPVAPVIQHAPIKAEGAPPILVVGTTGDPATPYQMAVSLAAQLSSGVLVTHIGEGHTSLGEGSDCVDTAVSNYVIALTPPPDKSVCGKTGSPTPAPSTGTIAFRP